MDETTRSPRTTRRAALKTGLVVLAAGGMAGTAAAQQKLAKTVVQYQEMPKNGQKCSLCVNFIAPNACKLVAGNINPNGWCVAFAPKQA